MGIFGALTTAVTGMRAQSFALENVSGNIANSQTTAFKRMDTSFVDLIPDAVPSKQTSGNIVANSRATNGVQGDIQSASIGTFMAINGDGFFVVQKPGSFQDNRPIFDGIDLYTRRGDFQPDKNGYLVNGAGYYLLGIPVDPMTGNLVGSVPELLQFQSDFLPAQQTSSIEYRANVASYPLTPKHDKDIPRSELLQAFNYQSNPVAGPAQNAKITGSGATLLPDAFAQLDGANDISALSSAGGTLVINGQNIVVAATDDGTDIMNAINANGVLGPIMTASLVGGRLRILGDNHDTAITIGAGTTAALLTEIGITAGTSNPTNLITQNAVQAGQTMIITVEGSAPTTVTFGTGGNTGSLTELTAALAGLAGGTATVGAGGNITITAGNGTSKIDVTGTADPENFGMQVSTAYPADEHVIAVDVDTFVGESIGGGAITAYDISGSPVNLQLRWAKIDSALYPPGVDTWNLFYQVNSNPLNPDDVAWQNVGINYTFGANGQMSPPVVSVTLQNVVVDGVQLGDVLLLHGAGGVTQFADPNGNVQVNLLQQNGFPAGELQQVAVNDKGRVVGSYSNGRTIDLAEITLANFNGVNGLRRIDGGAFAATDESGVATYGAPGRIVNSSLEGSNTDIADEFTKLIITQQAYSANTRVITTANGMVQDLLNMLR